MKTKKRFLALFLAFIFTASAVPAAPISAVAVDDASGHWAAQSIDMLPDKGIISGYPDGGIRPSNGDGNGNAVIEELDFVYVADVRARRAGTWVGRAAEAYVFHTDGTYEMVALPTRGDNGGQLLIYSGDDWRADGIDIPPGDNFQSMSEALSGWYAYRMNANGEMQLRPIADLYDSPEANALPPIRAIQTIRQTNAGLAQFTMAPVDGPPPSLPLAPRATASTQLLIGHFDGNATPVIGFQNFGDDPVNYTVVDFPADDGEAIAIMVIFARDEDGAALPIITRIFVITDQDTAPETGGEIILLSFIRQDGSGFWYDALVKAPNVREEVAFTRLGNYTSVSVLSNMEGLIVKTTKVGGDLIATDVGRAITVLGVDGYSIYVEFDDGSSATLSLSEDSLIWAREGTAASHIEEGDVGWVTFNDDLEIGAISVDRPSNVGLDIEEFDFVYVAAAQARRGGAWVSRSAEVFVYYTDGTSEIVRLPTRGANGGQLLLYSGDAWRAVGIDIPSGDEYQSMSGALAGWYAYRMNANGEMQLRPIADLYDNPEANALPPIRAIRTISQTTAGQAQFTMTPVGGPPPALPAAPRATENTQLLIGHIDGNDAPVIGFQNFGDAPVDYTVVANPADDSEAIAIMVIFARDENGAALPIITRIFVITGQDAAPETGGEIILLSLLRRDSMGFWYRALTPDGQEDVVINGPGGLDLAGLEGRIVTITGDGDDFIVELKGNEIEITRVTGSTVFYQIVGSAAIGEATRTDDSLVLSRGMIGGALNANDVGVIVVDDGEIVAISVNRPYTIPVNIVTFVDWDGSELFAKEVEHGGTVIIPDDPVKAGHKFIGWYLGDELYDFDAPVTEDIILAAAYEALPPITSIRIDLNVITRVSRNSTTTVGINVNPGACPEKAATIVLTSSNQAMATIGEDGRSIITQNRAGTVTLTATLPGTNLRHSVTIMIT